METETRFLWKQRTSEKSFSQPGHALSLDASTKDYKRIRKSLPSLWSPITILGMRDNNGDIKKSLKVCQMVHSDFDWLSHLESTALSTVSGVKIFSPTVSWRKKRITFFTSTMLRRVQSFRCVMVRTVVLNVTDF